MDTGGAVLVGGVNNFVPSQKQQQKQIITNKLSQANNFDVQPIWVVCLEWALLSSKAINCRIAGNSDSFKATAEEDNE